MQRAAQQALEFHRIVEAVRGFAATPLGRDRLSGLRPLADVRRVVQALAATTEGTRYLADGGLFPLRAPPDIQSMLAALAMEGRPLEPLRLLASPTSWIRSTRPAEPFGGRPAPTLPSPRWSSRRRRSRPSAPTSASDRRAAARWSDHASPQLRAIRDRLRKQRARLRGTLESYLRGKETVQLPAGPGRHRPQRPLRAGRPGRAPGGDPRHHPRRLGQRREPVPRAAEHRRNQQRHRRARGAGGRRGPADPAAS